MTIFIYFILWIGKKKEKERKNYWIHFFSLSSKFNKTSAYILWEAVKITISNNFDALSKKVSKWGLFKT